MFQIKTKPAVQLLLAFTAAVYSLQRGEKGINMKTKLLELYSSDSEVQAAVCIVTYLYTAVLSKALFLPHFP